MTNKIVNLFGDKLPDEVTEEKPFTPDPGLLQAAEEILEAVRAGGIRGMFTVLVRSDLETTHVMAGDHHPLTTLGEIELMKADIIDFEVSARAKEDE